MPDIHWKSLCNLIHETDIFAGELCCKHAQQLHQLFCSHGLLQAAAQAQAIRDARKEKSQVEGNVNDMENAQDFLKAGNVKVCNACTDNRLAACERTGGLPHKHIALLSGLFICFSEVKRTCSQFSSDALYTMVIEVSCCQDVSCPTLGYTLCRSLTALATLCWSTYAQLMYKNSVAQHLC